MARHTNLCSVWGLESCSQAQARTASANKWGSSERMRLPSATAIVLTTSTCILFQVSCWTHSRYRSTAPACAATCLVPRHTSSPPFVRMVALPASEGGRRPSSVGRQVCLRETHRPACIVGKGDERRQHALDDVCGLLSHIHQLRGSPPPLVKVSGFKRAGLLSRARVDTRDVDAGTRLTQSSVVASGRLAKLWGHSTLWVHASAAVATVRS